MPLILVADGDRDTRLTLRQLFKQENYTVIEAEDGEQCLALAAQWKPDVLLLDSDLPVLSGLKVCARLRAEKASTPILMMLPDDLNAAEAAFTAGANDVIAKPVHWKTLAHRAKTLVQVHSIERLKEEQAWYASLFANAMEGVFRSLIDPGRFLYVNRALATILGYEGVDELLALKSTDDLYFERAEAEQVRALIAGKGGAVEGMEVRWKRKDGEPVYVALSVRTVPDAEGKPAYREGVALNISERKRIEESLAKERNLLRTLIDHLPDYVYFKDMENRYLIANQTLARMMAVDSPRHLIGKTDYDFYPLETASGLYMDEQSIMRSGQPISRDGVLTQHLDGQSRWMHNLLLPVRDGSGIVMGIMGVGRDISDRVRGQQALQYRLQFEALITSISTQFITLPPTEINTAINDALRRIGDFASLDRAGLFLLTPDSAGAQLAHLWVRDGRPSTRTQAGDIVSLSAFPWLIERVREGKLLQVPRVADLPPEAANERGAFEGSQTRSVILVPLQDGVRLIGYMILDSLVEKSWSDDETALFQILGEILSNALQRKRVDELLRASQAELRAKSESLQAINSVADTVHHSLDTGEVVDGALRSMMRYLNVSLASIYALDEAEGVLRLLTSPTEDNQLSQVNPITPLDGSIAGIAVARKVIVTSPDLLTDARVAEQVKAGLRALERSRMPCAIVPLILQEQVVGTLHVIFDEERSLSIQELETLLAIGQTIALALDNARTVARIEAEVSERQRAQAAEHEQRVLAEALRDAAAALNSARTTDEVLDRILEQIDRVVPNDLATIFLINGDEARPARFRGFTERRLDDWMMDVIFNIPETPSFRRLIETRAALIIGDTHQFDGWVYLDQTSWIHSFVSVPLMVEDEVIGAITLDAARIDAFSTHDAERLQAFADQASIALHNIRLYEAVQRHAAELEDRVRARTAELERERAQLHAILDSISDGVTGMIVNPVTGGTDYRFINHALFEMTGYSVEEWDPRLLKSASVSDEAFDAGWQEMLQALETKGIWHTEFRARRKDGSEFDSSMTITRVADAEGRTIGAVTVLRDVSQQKALEAQKARFVASASHELRTPITNLKTRLYLAQRQPERMPIHLQILEQVTDQMKVLVDNLLDMSRFERGVIHLDRQDIILQDLLGGVVSLQQPEAEQKRQTLTSELPLPPMMLNVDAPRLTQVITNLVMNAINYTPEGGAIVVRAVPDGGDHVLIQVGDSGVGIPPEHLPHVFEPFYQGTNASKGIGLGLSIAKEIIEMHGGEISVESEVGKGTCFTIRMKLSPILSPSEP
jgi:PAS domain S-box-containing protein